MAKAERSTLQDLPELIKVLYNGAPGSGKTTDLAHLAKLGKIVHVNAEAGLKQRPLRRMDVPLDNIEIFPDPNRAGETISYDCLDALFWDLKARLDDDPNCIVGTMWDSGTEIVKTLLEREVEDQITKGVEKADKRGEEPPERDIFDVYQEDWGTVTEQMRHLLRRFRDLPIHMGFATLPRRDQDDDGTVTYGPGVNPALQTDLMGYFDLICFVEEEDLPDDAPEGFRFVGHFRRHGKYQAKDRFGALPPRLYVPTFDRVIAYVNDVLTVDTDPVQQEATEYRLELANRARAARAEKVAAAKKNMARPTRPPGQEGGEDQGGDQPATPPARPVKKAAAKKVASVREPANA